MDLPFHYNDFLNLPKNREPVRAFMCVCCDVLKTHGMRVFVGWGGCGVKLSVEEQKRMSLYNGYVTLNPHPNWVPESTYTQYLVLNGGTARMILTRAVQLALSKKIVYAVTR